MSSPINKIKEYVSHYDTVYMYTQIRIIVNLDISKLYAKLISPLLRFS